MEASKEKSSNTTVVKISSSESWESSTAIAMKFELPVVVHFAAEWCWPSVYMNSCFEDLSLSYPDGLFLHVDVDDAQSVMSQMGVKWMPTFLLMKKGKIVDKIVGMNRSVLKKRVDQFMSKGEIQHDL